MSSDKNIDAARKFLWDDDDDVPPGGGGGGSSGVDPTTPSVSGRVFAGGRTDPNVDQSMNLHDVNLMGGGGGRNNNDQQPRPSGHGGRSVIMDRVSFLFRPSETNIVPQFDDEYGGDASPSTEAEEYLHTDSKYRRRLSPIVASMFDTLNTIGFGKVLCIILSVGIVFFIFGLGSSRGGSSSNSSLSPSDQRKNEIMKRILDAKITHTNRLKSTHSSPHKALEWIVYDDPAQLPTDHEDLLERYVLAVIYYETNGHPKDDDDSNSGWKRNDNWLSGKGICIWYGVKCSPKIVDDNDGESGVSVGSTNGVIDIYDDNAPVISIELPDNNVIGKLPSELSGLVSLLTLDLSENTFTGHIPTELGKMFAIRSISLRKNALSGKIPSQLSQLSGTIHELNLGQNQLSGTIPTEFGEMEQLRDFSVAENKLHGTIPDTLRELTKLTIFYADQNKITGTIPDYLNEWTSLVDLRLSNNKFTGTIPAEMFYKLYSLEILRCDHNAFSGKIPDIFEHTSRLQELTLNHNHFVGTIPPNIGKLTGLKSVNLNRNKLTGSFPDDLGFLTDVVQMDVSKNMLTGTIPTMLGWLDDIETLHLNDNKFTGVIPTELGKSFRLVSLSLATNELWGEIPTELGLLHKLEKLELHNNLFTNATMPQQVCNLGSDENLQRITADCDVSCTCCTECM